MRNGMTPKRRKKTHPTGGGTSGVILTFSTKQQEKKGSSFLFALLAALSLRPPEGKRNQRGHLPGPFAAWLGRETPQRKEKQATEIH